MLSSRLQPAVAGRLLAGGATVVATSSRLTHERLEFATTLYREHAAAGAKLWMVPANLSSYRDVDALADTADGVGSGYDRARALEVMRRGNTGPMGVAAGALLMEVGRPVLVAPPGIERLAAKRVVVAWKDTREARRAVHDALPFLTRADEVLVAVVGPDADREGAEDVAEGRTVPSVAAQRVLDRLRGAQEG